MAPNELHFFAIGVVCGASLLFMLWLGFKVIAPWVRGLTSGGNVSLLEIVGMRLRGNPPDLLIDAYVSLVHGEVQTSLREVESAYIVNRVQVLSSQDLVEIIREKQQRNPVQSLVTPAAPATFGTIKLSDLTLSGWLVVLATCAVVAVSAFMFAHWNPQMGELANGFAASVVTLVVGAGFFKICSVVLNKCGVRLIRRSHADATAQEPSDVKQPK